MNIQFISDNGNQNKLEEIFAKSRLNAYAKFCEKFPMRVRRVEIVNVYNCTMPKLVKLLEESYKELYSTEADTFSILTDDGVMMMIWCGDRVSYIELNCYVYSGSIEQCQSGIRNIRALLDEYIVARSQYAKSIMKWYQHKNGLIEYRAITQEIAIDYDLALKYPYLEEIDKRIEDFLTSDSSVLLLKGEPGTGKTSLIRQIIAKKWQMSSKLDKDYYVEIGYATDENVFLSDTLFIDYVKGAFQILALEDADSLLLKRSEGNNHVTRLLNSTDGLIKASGNKVIISTNLKTFADIDTALLREGRCYDIIETKPLNLEQTKALAKKLEIPTDGFQHSSYTLAQIYKHKGDRFISSVERKPAVVGFR